MTQTTTERLRVLVDAHCTNDYGRFHPNSVATLALAAYRMALDDAAKAIMNDSESFDRARHARIVRALAEGME